MNTGNRFGGDPAVGAWTTYGLGTLNQNLPAFVVLPEGAFPQGGAANWSNGFLPAHYQGTPLRPSGSPILDLDPPPGVTREAQRANLDLLAELNARAIWRAIRTTPNSPPAWRPTSWPSACRPRCRASSTSPRKTRRRSAMYGIGEPETDSFGRRCLLARKLVRAGRALRAALRGGLGLARLPRAGPRAADPSDRQADRRAARPT